MTVTGLLLALRPWVSESATGPFPSKLVGSPAISETFLGADAAVGRLDAGTQGESDGAADSGLGVEHAPVVQQVPASRLSGSEFRTHMKTDARKIGSVSFGFADRGFLWNGHQLRDDTAWTVVDPKIAWGTQETVSAIKYAVHHVQALFEDTHPLHIGHISRRLGGGLRPHKSHQSGRDADIGFYYSTQPKWYRPATEENFDLARNWALIDALTTTTDVQYIFVDQSLIELLRKQSTQQGLAGERLEQLFGNDRGQGIIRHARGHRTHFHVRFTSPDAVRAANFLRGYYGKRARRSAFVLRQLRSLAKHAELTERRLALRKKQAAAPTNR